tara:strand:- start:1232 stop:1606 length:375 start_codon:yes stop_codon:yes gene_type:complete
MNKITLIIILFCPIFLLSVEPDEILKSVYLEERAREISKQLRCMVCQNEDIDNSTADIARDLRILVRDMLMDGKTDKQILNFVHEKYGDFILFNPPIKFYTLLLWVCPFLFFFIFLYLFFRKRT